MGFEKALGAVKVIKDQIQYRSQSLLNLARGYFGSFHLNQEECLISLPTSNIAVKRTNSRVKNEKENESNDVSSFKAPISENSPNLNINELNITLCVSVFQKYYNSSYPLDYVKIIKI